MLAYSVAAIGVAISLLGAAVLVAPAAMREVVRSLQTPRTVYAAVGVRILAGAFLIFASEACAWPMAVGTVGVIIVVAGFAGLFIGPARLQALMAWFYRLSDGAWRSWSLIAIAFGAFIVYAAV
jgi:hypothetical protein